MVNSRRQLGRARLLLLLVVLRSLVQVGAQAMGARGSRGVGLWIMGLRKTLGELLGGLLALWNYLVALSDLVSRRGFVVYCQRLVVSRTHYWMATRSLTRGVGRRVRRREVDRLVRAIRLFGEYRRHRRVVAASSSWNAAGGRGAGRRL
jgi:hypothetical protein